MFYQLVEVLICLQKFGRYALCVGAHKKRNPHRKLTYSLSLHHADRLVTKIWLILRSFIKPIHQFMEKMCAFGNYILMPCATKIFH